MSTPPPPLFVHATGMACPIGLTTAAACAALRAGISRRQELPYLDDDGRPVVGSYLARIPAGTPRRERIASLAAVAIADALRGAANTACSDPWILVLADDIAAELGDGAAIRAQLARRGVPFAPSETRIVAEGSCGLVSALALARSLFARRQCRACTICAADSLICAGSLARLAGQGRLLTEDNPDGVTPGEAAVCLRLSPSGRGASSRILGTGTARESATLRSDEPLRGDGIAAAAQGALAEAGLAFHDIDFRVSDAAGESYHFKEQILLVSRLLRSRRADLPLWLCAAELGDTGAAAGLCGLVTATEAFRRGRVPGPRALVFAGADDGRRSAVVLSRGGNDGS
ncbi:hypothetical protein [Nannocystis radixulma]|uniref:3-oxoacyl-[acyl-carrier-protein] synthase-1 n=1 Tax=Nannocystis radixulma TaxID=2995305 RepID=A0ABT5B1W0_9BACT|nr:hypothetical protein [Nannocystis radixulma]MDC0668094.1 hypothetical protein [Nannocystis radixulma]